MDSAVSPAWKAAPPAEQNIPEPGSSYIWVLSTEDLAKLNVGF